MSEHPKILIVDDKPENLFALAKVLQKLPLTIIQATSGTEALTLVLEHDFFAAIVDVQMPEMDGYELVELLRGNASTAALPVIFVSAIFSDEYHHRKGYDAGAVDFLSKPFVPEILLSKVRVFLELYHQRRRLQALVTELNAANAEVRALNDALEEKVRARTAELEQAYQDLALLDQNKTDFIQIISHELRTPLTLVKGFSQILLKAPPIAESEVYCQQVQGIVTGAMRMHDIVDGMLDIVKIDSRALTLECASLTLALLLGKQERFLSPALQERGLTLTVTGLDTLPDIVGDQAALLKVFNHLLSNAIKYTPDGGAISVTGRFFSLANGAGDFVEVVVSDTGIGIDPAVHELIFTKFYQTGQAAFHSSGKTKFKGGGPGLGLAIARGIVEAHGGRIWVESSGHDEETCPGSQFHVLLPLKPELAAPVAAIAARVQDLIQHPEAVSESSDAADIYTTGSS